MFPLWWMGRWIWSTLLSPREGNPSLSVLKPGNQSGIVLGQALSTDQSSGLVRQFCGLGPDFVERGLQRRLFLLERRDLVLENLQVRRILRSGGRCLSFECIALGSEGCDLVLEFHNRPVQSSDLLSDTLSQFLASVIRILDLYFGERRARLEPVEQTCFFNCSTISVLSVTGGLSFNATSAAFNRSFSFFSA